MLSIKYFLQIVVRPLTNFDFLRSKQGILGRTLKARYKILQKLGEGGFGKTYLVEDLNIPIKPLKRRVVKQLLSQKINLATKFKKEANALARLDHPQIPVLCDYFEFNGIPYIVQDYIEGHDLSKEIASSKDVKNVDTTRCWTEQDVVGFLVDMLGILNYIHAQGIIHRDIKPSNIMRREADDMLILIDFGLVKNINVNSSSQSEKYGTNGYTPVEQWSGKVQFNSDIYALGMTVIQAITGLNPNRFSNEQLLFRLEYVVSPALFAIVSSMVEVDYKKRFQSAKEALLFLQPLQVSITDGYRSPSRFVRRDKLSGTKPVIHNIKVKNSQPNQRNNFRFPNLQSPRNQRWISQALDKTIVFITTLFILVYSVLVIPLVFPESTIAYDVFVMLPFVNGIAYNSRGILKANRLNDNRGALNDYNQAIEINPERGYIYGNRGNLKAYKLKDIEGALSDYAKAIEISPQSADIYKARGDLKVEKLNDLTGALDDYNKAIRIDPKIANFYKARGDLKVEEFNDLTGALDDYDKAIEIDPKIANFYKARGDLKVEKLNDLTGALDDYDKAIEIAPPSADTYKARGDVKMYKLNDLSGALSDYSKAIEIDSKYTYAYKARGDLKTYKLNDLNGALDDYTKSIGTNPRYAYAYKARGDLKVIKLNDPKGALDDYEKAIEIDPKIADIYKARGDLRGDNFNDLKGAVDDYNKAIELSPQYIYPYVERGVLKTFKLNDTKGAMEDFNKAVKIDSRFAYAYYSRGNLKKDKLNDTLGAIKDFRQAAKFYRQQGKIKGLQSAINSLKILGASE
jgi:serine/threonine protein kinase/Tfp pilus assembly protein PilF